MQKLFSLSSLSRCGFLTCAMVLCGCALEVENLQPSQELKRLANPPGTVYAGWRVFQDKCSGCHGPDATGAPGAPDVLATVRQMGQRQFISLVLRRYDWGFAATPPGSAAGEAMVEDMVQRRQYMLSMPAWQEEPRVNAHIADLYAYLRARADGTQGLGRPPQ
jgi:hypothetical protein